MKYQFRGMDSLATAVQVGKKLKKCKKLKEGY